MTPDEINRIHDALKKHRGDRKATAKALGMTKVALRNAVTNNSYLAWMWQTTRATAMMPLTDEELLMRQQSWDRDHPKPLPMNPNLALAAMNQKISLDGLASALKLNLAEIDFADALQKFWGEQYTAIQDVVCGNVGQQSIKLGMEFNRCMERLATGQDEDGRKLTQEEMLMDRKFVLQICAETRKQAEMMNTNATEKMKLALKKQEISKVGVKGRFGLSPLLPADTVAK